MIDMLIHDNCLNALKSFDSDQFEVGFTSPPYNRKRNDKYVHYNDTLVDWYQLNKSVIGELLRVCKRHVFYNIQANYYNRKDVYRLIGEFSDKIIDIHIWQKSNPMPSPGLTVTNAVEYFIVLGHEKLKSNKTYTKNIVTTSVNSNMPKEHKAVMNPEVARHFLNNFTQSGDHVIDPFLGVGTTGCICNELGLKFTGIELIKEYYELAVQNTTGEV